MTTPPDRPPARTAMRSPVFLALLVFAVLAAIVGGGGYARSRRATLPDRKEIFIELLTRFDTDHDGQISAAEWQAARNRPELFAAGDTRGNGQLDATALEVLFRATDPRPLHP